MATSPKRIYWDACAWIALIQNEQIVQPNDTLERRGSLCRAVIDEAVKGKVEIFTSAFCLVEVCKKPDTWDGNAEDKLRAFFENDYIVVVNLDRQTGEYARKLMLSGIPKLKPADASHLASAAIADAAELHTFDAALLALDGVISKLDGTRLRICKPSQGGPPLPLMDVGGGGRG